MKLISVEQNHGFFFAVIEVPGWLWFKRRETWTAPLAKTLGVNKVVPFRDWIRADGADCGRDFCWALDRLVDIELARQGSAS